MYLLNIVKTVKTQSSWRDYFSSVEATLACPVLVTSNGQQTVLGTATFLTPGMFLTAKHVIEDTPIGTAGNKIEIWHMRKGGKALIWKVEHTLSLSDYDVSILLCSSVPAETIALIKDHAFGRVSIDLHAPTIGDRVRALGYPFPKSTTPDKPFFLDDAHDISYVHDISLWSMGGKVEEIYYQGAGLVKNPCFQTDAAIDRGMSGGPVLNKNGFLCGIVSSGIEPTDEAPFYTAFVSLLAQAFITELDNTVLSKEARNLFEYSINTGHLKVLGAEHFRRKSDHYEWRRVAPDCQICGSLDSN